MDSALEPLARGVSNAGSAALEIQQRRAAIEQQRAQTKLTLAQAQQLQGESAGRIDRILAQIANLGASTRLSDATSAVRHLDEKFLSDTMRQRVAQVTATLGLTGARGAEAISRTRLNAAQRKMVLENLDFMVRSREGRLAAIEIVNRLNAARADHEPVRQEYTSELIRLLQFRMRAALKSGKLNDAGQVEAFMRGLRGLLGQQGEK